MSARDAEVSSAYPIALLRSPQKLVRHVRRGELVRSWAGRCHSPEPSLADSPLAFPHKQLLITHYSLLTLADTVRFALETSLTSHRLLRFLREQVRV